MALTWIQNNDSMVYVKGGNAVINVFFVMERKFFSYFHSLAFCAVEREKKPKKSEHENFGENLATLHLAIKISEMQF